MNTTTMRRTGTWVVELVTPIQSKGKEIRELVIRPPDFDLTLRWGEGAFPSTLSFLAELCNVPEKALRTMIPPDIDRVLMAYYQVVPPSIKTDFEQNAKPMATPAEEMPEAEQRMDDPVDPRFPRADGPVTRVPQEMVPETPEEPADEGLKLDPSPPMMKAVS